MFQKFFIINQKIFNNNFYQFFRETFKDYNKYFNSIFNFISTKKDLITFNISQKLENLIRINFDKYFFTKIFTNKNNKVFQEKFLSIFNMFEVKEFSKFTNKYNLDYHIYFNKTLNNFNSFIQNNKIKLTFGIFWGVKRNQK